MHIHLFVRTHDNYRRAGFTTISAFGSHSAQAHYTPTIETDKQITRDEIYLLKAGTQYKGKIWRVSYFMLFAYKLCAIKKCMYLHDTHITFRCI